MKKETIQNENKTSDHYDDNPVSRTDRPFSVHQFSFAPVRNVLGYVIVPFQNGINEVGTWMTDQKKDSRA